MRTRFAVLPALLMVTAAAAQSQPLSLRFAGTWTLNISQSKLHAPAPQNESIVIEPSSTDTLATKYTITGTDGTGKPINLTFEGKVDGQHYPVTSGGQNVGKLAWRRTGSRQVSGHEIDNDGTTASSTVTLSADGKSYTIQQHIVSKSGAFDQTSVWDKT